MIWVRRGLSLVLALLLMVLLAAGVALVTVRVGGLQSAEGQPGGVLGAVAGSLREALAAADQTTGLPADFYAGLPLEQPLTSLVQAMLAGEDRAQALQSIGELFRETAREYALQNGFTEGPVLDAALEDYAEQSVLQLSAALERLLPQEAAAQLPRLWRGLLYGLIVAAVLGVVLAVPLVWLNWRELRFLGWGAAVLLGSGGLLLGAALLLGAGEPAALFAALPPERSGPVLALLGLLAGEWRLWAFLLLAGGLLLIAVAFLLRIPRVRAIFYDKSFLLFLGVGVVNTFNGIAFAWLYSLALDAQVAFVLGYISSLCVAYLLNTFVVFRQPLALRRFFKFALSYLPNFIIQFLVVLVVMTWLGLPKLVAYALAALIGMPVTFILLKLFAFARHQK